MAEASSLRPPRSPLLPAVLVLVVLVAIAAVLPGMRARMREDIPRDDVAASQGFIDWAVGSTLQRSGAVGVTALRLTDFALEVTVRTGDGAEQRWRALPQKPVELVANQPLTPTNGVVSGDGFAPSALMAAWTDLRGQDDQCEASDAQVDATVSWGGAIRYTSRCNSPEAQASTNLIKGFSSPNRIGVANVYELDSFAAGTSLEIVLRQLRQLAPGGQVGQLTVLADAGSATAGLGITGGSCGVEALWRQAEPDGTNTWLRQSRLCSAADGTMLPTTTLDAPADAAQLEAHRFDINAVDVASLVGHLQTTGLPAQQGSASVVQVAWSDRFNEVLARVSSGTGSDARTGWYSLTGEQLAMDAG